MSASALRYCPREDRNGELRERICKIAGSGSLNKSTLPRSFWVVERSFG
jgi:hypothetical protein